VILSRREDQPAVGRQRTAKHKMIVSPLSVRVAFPSEVFIPEDARHVSLLSLLRDLQSQASARIDSDPFLSGNDIPTPGSYEHVAAPSPG